MAIAGHYLQIRDDENHPVHGESLGHGFVGSIDVSGWDWDVTDPRFQKSKESASKVAGKGAAHSASGKTVTGDGHAGIEPALMRFSKVVDCSSIRLMQAMEARTKLQSAVFSLREEIAHSDDKRIPFLLTVSLKDVYVISYELSVRSSEYRVDLEETWDFHYSNIKFEFVSAGGGIDVDFDRKAGSLRGSSKKAPPDVEEIVRRANEDADRKKRKSV